MSDPETRSARPSSEQLLTDALADLDLKKREVLLAHIIQTLEPDKQVEFQQRLEEEKESLDGVVKEAILHRLNLVHTLLQSKQFEGDPQVERLRYAILRVVQERIKQDVLDKKDAEGGKSMRELFKEYGKGIMDFLFFGDANSKTAATMGVLSTLPVAMRMGLGALSGPQGWVTVLGQAKFFALFSTVMTSLMRLGMDSRGANFSDRVKNFFRSNQALLQEKQQLIRKEVADELQKKFARDGVPPSLQSAPTESQEVSTQRDIRSEVLNTPDPETGRTLAERVKDYGKGLADFLFFGDANKRSVALSGLFVGLGAAGVLGGPAGMVGALGVAKSMSIFSGVITSIKRLIDKGRGATLSERTRNFLRSNQSIIEERQKALFQELRMQLRKRAEQRPTSDESRQDVEDKQASRRSTDDNADRRTVDPSIAA